MPNTYQTKCNYWFYIFKLSLLQPNLVNNNKRNTHLLQKGFMNDAKSSVTGDCINLQFESTIQDSCLYIRVNK